MNKANCPHTNSSHTSHYFTTLRRIIHGAPTTTTTHSSSLQQKQCITPMGFSASLPASPRAQTTVPKGKIRICVAGFDGCPYGGRAHLLATEIAKGYPEQFESWFYWDSRDGFTKYIVETFDKVPFPTKLKGHSSCPLVWLEVAKSEAAGASAMPCNAMDGDNAVLQVVGGCTQFQHWAQRRIAKKEEQNTPSTTTATLLPKQKNEEASDVAHGPDTIFFKEDDPKDKAIVDAAVGFSFFSDSRHVVKYGAQTAAVVSAVAAE